MTTTQQIEIKLVQTNVFTRWGCDVCGGRTAKVPILAESEDGIRVCETCLESGNIDDRLRDKADLLEAMARGARQLLRRFHEAAMFEEAACGTRELIGRLIVPSFSEWQAAMATAEPRHAKTKAECAVAITTDTSDFPF